MKSTITHACSMLALMTCATATAAGAETLIVSNGLSPTHVVSTQGFDPWMACVTETTGGEVDFNYFPSGQLAPVAGSIDALNSGLAQVAFISPTNEAGKLPLGGIALLPGIGETSSEMTAAYRKVSDSGGPIAAEIAGNGIHPMIVNALPAYQIMSAAAPIKSFEDFSGRKTRVAGGAMGFTVDALGGVPVEMPAGDLYVAMQRGTVDSTIFAFSSVKTYSVQELITSMSRNASLGTSAQMIAISDDALTSMSPENQQALRDCGLRVETELAAYLDEENQTLADEFAALGIEIYDIPEDAMAEIDEHLAGVASDYVQRLEERGLPGQQAFDEYLAAIGD